MKFGYLDDGGLRGGDVVQLLSGVLENVIMSALAQVPHVAFRSCARAPLAILLVSLGFDVMTLLPQWGPG
jgi:hypothetical protein